MPASAISISANQKISWLFSIGRFVSSWIICYYVSVSMSTEGLET